MAKAFIDDTNLTNIASAIRTKLGVADTYLPSEMAGAILSIPKRKVVDFNVSPITLNGAKANSLQYVKAYGKCEQNGTPTPTSPVDIVCNNGVLKARHESGLPLGYTLLDYMVFNGTQVIDTGFTPNQDSKIVSKFNGLSTFDMWVYGTGTSNPRITCYLSTTGYQRFGNVAVDSTNISRNIINTVTQDKNGFYYNGQGKPYTSVGTFTAQNTLTIGNSNQSTGTPYFSGNFYYLKIYDNGTLVRDYVACKDSSNVVGFYDLVNGTFITDTGLTAGNTVSDPTIIYTEGNTETVKISRLPQGYQELEYIESSGTQCINTGIKYDGNDFTLEWKAIDKGPNLSTLFAATNYEPYSGGLYANTAGIRKFYVGSQAAGGVDLGYTYDSTTLHSWKLTVLNTDASLYKDGVLIGSATVPNNIDTQHVIYLFCGGKASNNNLVQFSKLCLYNWKLTKSGVLAFNGIPAKRLSDNVLGMYDFVSNTFLTNAGTGDFIGGPEINTATCERLLSLPGYTDTQEILNGVVARNLDVRVFDGTESWQEITNARGYYYGNANNDPCRLDVNYAYCAALCTHFNFVIWPNNINPMATNSIGYNIYGATGRTNGNITIRPDMTVYDTLEKWKAYLAEQYAAGTPVIVVRMATPTTESVTAQPMQTAEGDNTLEITQSALSGLEVECEYFLQ